ADALRVGDGPDRRHEAAVRRPVLPGRDRVPDLRRRIAAAVPVGRRPVECRARLGRRRRGPPGIPMAGARRRPGLPGGPRGRVRLYVEEGGLPMALNTAGVDPAPILTNAPSTRTTPGGIEVPENTIMTSVDSVVNWCRKYSFWPMPFATACCG